MEEETSEALSHPSGSIPNEAYLDDMNQDGAGAESPSQDTRPIRLPLSLHSFIQGHSTGAATSGNVGLSSFERDLAQYQHNRRLLPPWRPPPPSYHAATRSYETPGIEMTPLQASQARHEQVQEPPPQEQEDERPPREQEDEPQPLPDQAAPQYDNPAPAEVAVRVVAKTHRRQRDWVAICAVGGSTLLVAGVIAFAAAFKPAR